MKKHLIIFVSLSTLVFACQNADNNNLEKKKARLAELKAEEAKLEKEIAELDTTKKDEKTKIVAVTPISPSEFIHFTEVQGMVDAEENVMVSARAAGAITRINVQEGDMVRKGQVLAEIDNAIYMQGLSELDNSLELAKTVYEKQKRLHEQKIGTEIQYLTAKNNYEGLVKKRATMMEQIEMTRIKAPINGRVDDQTLKVGQVVAPGMPCIRVLNDSKMKVVAEIGESYISKVKEGNEVIISIPDLKKEIRAKVNFVSKSINALNRTFKVEAAIPSGNGELRANMVAALKIVDYKKTNTLVIPVNTIQKDGEGQYVLLADKATGKAKANKARIEVANIYNDKAEIRSGIKTGDLLITNGYQDLKQGDAITVK